MGCDAASTFTYGALDSGAVVQAASGYSVNVCGVLLMNTGTSNDAIITMRRADNSDTLMKIRLDNGQTEEIDIPWYADGGVEFVSDTDNTDVTIYHSSPGVTNNREYATKVKYTTLPTTDTAVQVDSGNPINVYGMVLSTTSATSPRNIEMRTADGNETRLLFTELHTASLLRTNNMISSIPFCADKGIEFVAPVGDAALHVTVFHSSTGV